VCEEVRGGFESFIHWKVDETQPHFLCAPFNLETHAPRTITVSRVANNSHMKKCLVPHDVFSIYMVRGFILGVHEDVPIPLILYGFLRFTANGNPIFD
jgi:hypothetical protein